MSRKIVITSDFGSRFDLLQIIGVIHSVDPALDVIIGEYTITPFSIIEGAFVIEQSSKYLPSGIIHIGVVDPGVGSDRKPIIIETKNFVFVGPDNGLFYPAVKYDGFIKAYAINPEQIGDTISHTFHGRDIFAKVAAYIASGRPYEQFATPLLSDSLKKLHFQNNQVLHIDRFGNIKVNNPALFNLDQIVTINLPTITIELPFKKTFSEVEVGLPVAYKGSHDILELAINQRSAAKTWGIEVEDLLTINP